MAKCTGVRCPMQYGYKVEECNHTECPYRTEPVTNADRIRAMSDEELAKKMRSHAFALANCSEKAWLEWLQSPAEKEGE